MHADSNNYCSSTAIIRAALFIGAALALSACTHAVDKGTTENPEVVKARVEAITVAPVASNYEVPGTVQSVRQMQVSSQMMGVILQLPVFEGQHVAAGQVVAVIDSRNAAAAMEAARGDLTDAQQELEEAKRDTAAAEYAKESAEANLTLAATTYQRYSALRQEKAVTQQDTDKAKAQYQTAAAELQESQAVIAAKAAREKRARAHIDRSRAALEQSRVQLTYARIVAPANGVIVDKKANIGDTAMPGVPLITIESEHYRLEVPVEESKTGRISIGQTVPVAISPLGADHISARVEEIVPSSDPQTRSFTAKLALPYQSGLRSGMYGTAYFPIGTKPIVAVPLTAVVNQGQLHMVYVVDSGGIARLRLIQTGKQYGDAIEVLSGLIPGEHVVIGDLQKLKDGVKVAESGGGY